MISFLIRKTWKNKWMVFCLLIGKILLVGVAASAPLYYHASMNQVLRRNMEDFGHLLQEYPALLTLNLSFNNVTNNEYSEIYNYTQNYQIQNILNNLGFFSLSEFHFNTFTALRIVPFIQREQHPQFRSLNLIGTDSLLDNIHITHGREPADYLVNGNTIEILASPRTLSRNNILFGELLELPDVRGQELFLQVVGLFEINEDAGFERIIIPFDSEHNALMSNVLIQNHFIPNYSHELNLSSHWTFLLDYTQMASRHIPFYISTLNYTRQLFMESGSIWALSDNFTDTFINHSAGVDTLSITLLILQLPIYVLLLLYIYMVSNRILQIEERDISILKSRGVSSLQIIIMYAIQGLFIGAVAFVVGINLGLFICTVLGASGGFLDLVRRTALVVEITPDTLILSFLAVIVSICTMLFPVVKMSRLDIISFKTKTTAGERKSLWQKIYLDFIFLIISIYALYSFSGRQDLMALMIREGRSIDPLLLISSSLFIIGAGLLCLRLFPYIVKLIFVIGKKSWSPSSFVPLISIIRSAKSEQFIMIFIIFTLSLGIFSAVSARTLNTNNEHLIRYLAGADLTFKEFWRRESPPAAGDWMGLPGTEPTRTVFFEPSFERFTNFYEVSSATRVLQQPGVLRPAGSITSNLSIQIMGIETKGFSETIWFRNDLLITDINHFLNALALKPNAALVSDFFRTGGSLKVGDLISITNEHGNLIQCVIVGFVEHWPGFQPVIRVEDSSVSTREDLQHMVITNLNFLQTQWGVEPYEVWMRTKSDSNRFFYDFAYENQLNLVHFFDADNAVTVSLSNPVLQSTNGILTVNFIISLTISFVGFLIYWIISIRSRSLQFGTFRAMGLGMNDIIVILVKEQLLITFTAVIIGILVGLSASCLFVPLIQISYTAADRVIPLMLTANLGDFIKLFIFFGVTIFMCLVGLTGFVLRLNVTQVLKLGED